MLDKNIKPFETAVRTLYAAAVGEDAALDDARINGDSRSGRLAVDGHGRLTYAHDGGARVTEIDIRTLALRTVRRQNP